MESLVLDIVKAKRRPDGTIEVTEKQIDLSSFINGTLQTLSDEDFLKQGKFLQEISCTEEYLSQENIQKLHQATAMWCKEQGNRSNLDFSLPEDRMSPDYEKDIKLMVDVKGIKVCEACCESVPCQHAVSIDGEFFDLRCSTSIRKLLIERNIPLPPHFTHEETIPKWGEFD